MIRDLLFDLAKIIDGAANGDAQKIVAYSHQLGDKLEKAGEPAAAKRIRDIVSAGKVTRLGLNRNDPTKSAPIPVDSESRLTVADESFYPKGSVELFLPDGIRVVVDEFLTFYRRAGELFAKGVGISPTMLVYGPPGCGKTQLAKFVASEAGLPLITARADGLISSYLGSTAKNIRQLFAHATSRPCVLFLDEFDSIAKMRDDDRELGELKRVVISLLQNIDAMGKDHILIAATNHDHLLDPAIWRRFACRLELGEPSELLRLEMSRAFLKDFGSQETIAALAAVTSGMNGSQIREAAENSIRQAVLAKLQTVTVGSVVRSALTLHPSLKAISDLTANERLKVIRAINPKFFTQTRLAEIVGVTQSTVSKALRGEKQR